MKICSKCREPKELDEFHRNKSNKDGRAYYCKDCMRPIVRDSQRKGRALNPERERENKRRSYLKHRKQRIEEARNWRKENPERQAAANKRYYEANREKIIAHNKAIYEKNREKILAYKKATYDPEVNRQRYNPDVHRKAKAKRRAAMYGNNSVIANVTFDEICIRDLGVCGICGEAVMENTPELDHIIPLAKGGAHEPENIQFAHRACNRGKSARLDYQPVAA